MSSDVAEHLDRQRRDRAKHLQSAARKKAGSDLDMAMLHSVTSQQQVAAAWGVSHSIVHDIRSGKRPLAEERVERLPEAVHDAYQQIKARRHDRAWVALPDVEACEATHGTLVRLIQECSEAQQALTRALADGHLSDAERREVATEMRDVMELTAAIVAALERE